MNKRKIINDPVYGFITIPTDLIFDLIEHPWFQRLSRIKQLGLTYLVYPGAQHSRMQHAFGAMHLMTQALDVLNSKGIHISLEEAEAAIVAILLHDLGHGPFSHTLENLFITRKSHEELTLLMMEKLNDEMDGKLSLAIEIFKGTYFKKFLHELVSSQLDMDRLDYLNRDSFFTGVAEGVIGYDRIIKMLSVKDNELVVELKGIYSVEKFLISRRLMYWQVYLHKTVLSAEQMLIHVMKRAKKISAENQIIAAPALSHFFNHLSEDFTEETLHRFIALDDADIFSSMKAWQSGEDVVLAELSKRLLNRKLFRIELRNEEVDPRELNALRQKLVAQTSLSEEDANYFVMSGSTSNHAYSDYSAAIKILFKDGSVKNISEASDLPNLLMLQQPVVKYFICYPKELVE